jgi:hypothetical protein
MMQNPKWEHFRQQVFAAKGAACEECGRVDGLEIHHPYYRRGRDPWQYGTNEVRVLCGEHHEAAAKLEDSAMLAFWAAYCRHGFAFLKTSIVSNLTAAR